MPPELHATFVSHALDQLRTDARVVGVAAAGSWITGTMDAHSDVDLVIAVRADAFAEVMAERAAIAASLGPVLAAFTGEHVGEPRVLICLYGPSLLHVDLKFVAVDDLAHRVEDPLILWEREHSMSRAMALGVPHWPAPDVQWIEDRFWVWLHYAALKIARGELFETVDFLAFLRSAVFGPLIARLQNRAPRGVRHLERDAPAFVPALRATIATHDRASCVTAVRAAVALYHSLRDQLAPPDLVRRTAAETGSIAFFTAHCESAA